MVKEVTGGRGQTILEIARENGIDIPYLCYHPRVSKTGACRICIVRVNDQMLKTSCTEPATNGMKVDTEDAEIIEIRRAFLRFLLSEGDHNCLYCDANGECELQALCFRYGVEQPTAGFPKNKRGQDYVSSQGLKRNEDRCVLCGRCVKACGEIQMNSVWDFAGRGRPCASYFGSLQKAWRVQLCTVRHMRTAVSDRRAQLPDGTRQGAGVGAQEGIEHLHLLRRRLQNRLLYEQGRTAR